MQCPAKSNEFGMEIPAQHRANHQIRARYNGLSLNFRCRDAVGTDEEESSFDQPCFFHQFQMLEMPTAVAAIIEWELMPEATMLWYNDIRKVSFHVFALNDEHGNNSHSIIAATAVGI